MAPRPTGRRLVVGCFLAIGLVMTIAIFSVQLQTDEPPDRWLVRCVCPRRCGGAGHRAVAASDSVVPTTTALRTAAIRDPRRAVTGDCPIPRYDAARLRRGTRVLCRRDGCTAVRVVGGAGDLGADVIASAPDGRKSCYKPNVTDQRRRSSVRTCRSSAAFASPYTKRRSPP